MIRMMSLPGPADRRRRRCGAEADLIIFPFTKASFFLTSTIDFYYYYNGSTNMTALLLACLFLEVYVFRDASLFVG